jgi:hypothetical protein
VGIYYGVELFIKQVQPLDELAKLLLKSVVIFPVGIILGERRDAHGMHICGVSQIS